MTQWLKSYSYRGWNSIQTIKDQHISNEKLAADNIWYEVDFKS